MENVLSNSIAFVFVFLIVFLVLCILKFNNRQYKQLSNLLDHQTNLNLGLINELKAKPERTNYNQTEPPRLFPSRATDADEADIEEMRLNG